MSNETSNTGSSIASYALMPSIYVGTNMVNNARYFKNPIKPLGDATKKFGELTQKANLDTFQRAQFTSESFEAFRSASISARKAEKKLKKLQAIKNGTKKVSIKDHILNIFRGKKNKINADNIASLTQEAQKAHQAAASNVAKIQGAKNADELREVLCGIDEGYKNSMRFIRGTKAGESALKSFGLQTFDNFKKEFSFKKGNRFNAGLNVAMTAVQFIPNITEKVIPAFKNNGFKAGITELGQTIVQAGADLVSYAAGGAVGRTIGAAVGAIAGPMGAFFGGLVGDMVGSMFVGSKVCGVVEKITSKDDAKNTGITQEDYQVAQTDENQMTESQNPIGHLNVDNENLTPEQLRQLVAAQQLEGNTSDFYA